MITSLIDLAAEILGEPDAIERRRLVLESTDLLAYLQSMNVENAEACTAILMEDSSDWLHVFIDDKYSSNLIFYKDYEIHIKKTGFHFEMLFDGGKNDFHAIKLLDGLKTARGLE